LTARILSYGYDSYVPTAEYVVQRTLYYHAKDLLRELEAARRDCPRRPLIFVGHSLGGVIVKSALIFSGESETDESRGISLSTVGIIFFGTPFHGYGNTQGSSWLQAIVKAVSLSELQHEAIIEHLEKEAITLQNQLQPFEAISSEIPMVAVYETQLTAELGIVGFWSVPIRSTYLI